MLLLYGALAVLALCFFVFHPGRGVEPVIARALHAAVTLGLLAAVVRAHVLRRRALRQLGW